MIYTDDMIAEMRASISLEGVYAARKRIADFLKPTPLLRHPLLDEALGMPLWVKHENHLPTGAFKIRGGYNYMAQLDEDERKSLVETLAKELTEESLTLYGIEIGPDRVQIYLENRRYHAMPRALGRAARALTRTMPPSVELFEITPVENSVPVSTVVLKRSELENQIERPDAAKSTFATATIKDAAPVNWDAVVAETVAFPRYDWEIYPTFQHQELIG